MIFEWDSVKAEANEANHGVTFPEAASVFGDRHAITYRDPDHSYGEDRFLTFGLSRRDRLLVVAHVEIDEDHIRIISARRATRRERHEYEERV